MGVRDRFGGFDARRDGIAGMVLGVESVPDGLAGGMLAGLNPVFGLHAYMVGTFTGALATSSSFMAVQATGAMAMVIADVHVVHHGVDPDRALFTLAVLTGVVMLVAGLARLGTLVRYVSNAVMVGFISAVGVNIILGQLDNLTGYAATGDNRVVRAFDTVRHLGSWSAASTAVGVATLVLIVVLERTRLKAMGMVVAVALTSAVAHVVHLDAATVGDLAQVPNALPRPQLPDLSLIGVLLVPAMSLAFVGLVQGAGISAGFPNPNGTYPDPSGDFVGQGVANLASGVLRGMPVGGSMSATALVTKAGARSRAANLIAGVVVAVVILALGPVVELVAMPALAGLLMLVGYRTIKAEEMVSVWRTGAAQAAAVATTFVLTMVIDLQYAVLVGVAMSIVLYVVGRSNRLTILERQLSADGVREVAPPAVLPAHAVVVLQPYGSLFFASAATFESQAPTVAPTSVGSVVILRLRGVGDLGSTFSGVLKRYAEALDAVGSKLVLVSAGDRVQSQLRAAGAARAVGTDNIYDTDEWVGATLRRAHDDASAWVDAHR